MIPNRFFLLISFILATSYLHVSAQDTLIDLTHLYHWDNTNGNVDFYKDSSSQHESNPNASALQKKYSALLHVGEYSITNISLFQFIDDWYGTPYHYSGNSKSGIDCSGFTARLQLDVFQKTISGSAASLYNLCEPLKKNELQEGDLVFFKIGKSYVSHVGVYLMNGYFVHASTQAGVIISNLSEAYYTKYFFSGGRLK